MAHLKILGAGPVKRGVTQLAAAFERRSGCRVTIEFAGAPGVRDRIMAGEAVDVVVVPQSAMDEFDRSGRIAAGTRGLAGRSRMGVAVRKDAPVPDFASTESMTRALLDAGEIVCNVANSGVYFLKLLDQLGIAEAARHKVRKLPDTVKVMEHVAGSTARAIGVGQLAEISELVEKGVAITAAVPLPDAVQNVTAYHAAAVATSGAPDAAGDLARFLASAEARPVFAATGID